MEKVDISKSGSQAKILGTIIAFGGATLMTLFKGPTIISFHSQRSHHQSTTGSRSVLLDKDAIKGSLMLLVSFVSFSAFYILQVKSLKPIMLNIYKPLASIDYNTPNHDHPTDIVKFLDYNVQLLFSNTKIDLQFLSIHICKYDHLLKVFNFCKRGLKLNVLIIRSKFVKGLKNLAKSMQIIL